MTNDDDNEIIPVVNVLGEQESNLNAVQIEEARSFLSSAYGLYCGAGADYHEGCNRDVTQLKTLWESDFIRKNKQIPKRSHPFLVINEKKGRGLHREINGKYQYCGNVNFLCKSCNMIYSRRTDDMFDSTNASYNVKKSKRVRLPFRNKIRHHLIQNTHACMKEIFNKWSGNDEFKTTQETLQNAYDQEFDVSLDEIDVGEYGIDCKYKKCNGTHIIIKGEPPVMSKEVRDNIAFSKETTEKS